MNDRTRAFGALVLVLAGTLHPSLASAGAEESRARAELESAQRAYAQALTQLHEAQGRLASARMNAIEAGVLDLDAVTSSTLGSVQPQAPQDATPAATPAGAEDKPKDSQAQPQPKPKADPKPAPKPKPEIKPEPQGPSFWEKWKRNVRLGLNASSGNTENQNVNVQFNASRSTKKLKTTLNTSYRFATRNGNDTQNRLDLRGRHEWLAQGDSKIGWWITARAEVDEFQSWDYRLQAHTGVSYKFLDEEKTKLKARTGFGGSRTFGAPNDEFRPEALVTGIDLSHRFNDTMNVEAESEYFLEVTDESRERISNRIRWNILLDKESNMNLRFELAHQYDSEPGRSKDPNDIYFDITLGWRF